MPNNLTLASGELWFDRFLSNDTPRGERYIGSTTSFTLSIDQTQLEHEDADHGFKVMDESVTVKMGMKATFVTDNPVKENLALFFFGYAATLTSGAVTAGVQSQKVFKGLTYQIGASLANPSGLRTLSSLVVKKGVTALTEDVDYSVDMAMGRVTMNPTSAYASGDVITFEYESPTQSRFQIVSGREPVDGSMRFISYNAIGHKVDYYMPFVKLYPQGDLSLKGDEWMTLPFDVQVLKKEGLEFLYVDGRPF